MFPTIWKSKNELRVERLKQKMAKHQMIQGLIHEYQIHFHCIMCSHLVAVSVCFYNEFLQFGYTCPKCMEHYIVEYIYELDH